MGMDVFGIQPAADAGRYFRASIWGWRPLWERMEVLCGDFLSQEMLSAMAFNDGAGPQDQATCTRIAERLEEWLRTESSHEFCLADSASTLRVTPEGKLVSRDELTAQGDRLSSSPYSISREHITEFCEFLRCCGGFNVW